MSRRILASFAVAICLCGVVCSMSGCEGGVREDRSINFSPDGGSVGFQHGDEGLFVADPETGKVQRIFKPDDDILASSSPLWSPVGKQLIFATARSAEPDEPDRRITQPWDARPAGRRFGPGDVTYTCWLREEATGENPFPEPRQLFDAACDHQGYVAANLAVGWHPGGGSVFYIDQLPDRRHGLFEFNLVTQQKRRFGELSGAALIFDWSPGGKYLACVVLDGSKANPQGDGIWLLDQNGQPWWHVPGSAAFEPDRPAVLSEYLRTTRPAWHRDDDHFAFVIRIPSDEADKPSRSAIVIAEAASRKVGTLYEGEKTVQDLHWHPHEERLGMVLGDVRPMLHVIDDTGVLGPPLSTSPVRSFVGWESSGRRLAYITPDDVATHQSGNWAFLFPPSNMPRDCLKIVDTRSDDTVFTALAGMRVTFPKWSPGGDTLSLWCTFSPTHRSWQSGLNNRIGLQPGDPAATVDARNGEIEWMAVNSHEKVQIGHYYLLKRDFGQAWKWYEEAAHDRSEPSNASGSRSLESRVGFEQSPELFEYICLTKLERHEDARKKLEEFHRAFEFAQDFSEKRDTDESPEAREFSDLPNLLVRDSYIVEVYLSLDLAEDGVVYFDRAVTNSQTDGERLVHAIALSQMLLLTNRHDDYAQLAVETIAPLLLKLLQSVPDDEASGDAQRDVFYLGVCLLPMFSAEFLATIDRDQLESCITVAQQFSTPGNDDAGRLGADLVLHAAYTVLADHQQREQAAERIKANLRSNEILGNQGIDGLARMISEARKFRW